MIVFLWLLAAGLVPGRVHAQSPGPDGGTLTPASSTECPGFNSGTLTLTGFTGTVLRFQFDNGNGFMDIANSGGRTTYTYSNLFQTTRYRALVQNGTNAAVTSTVATVTVDPAPTATINSAGPTRFCQRGTIYLIAGPTGPYTYQYQLNGRDIAGATGQSYTTDVTAGGSYSVRVTNAAGCSSTSSSVVVQVTPGNVVNLNAAGPTTVCQGGAVPLTANVTGAGANNYTYQYLRNGVEIPGATNATFQATASGSYMVVVYNPSTCSSTSTAVTVTVNPVPVVNFRYGSATYCVSGSATPTPTATPTGGTFSSTTGLSLNASTGALNLAQTTPGTYAVTYAVGGSCPASATTNVTVTAAPTATFAYASGAAPCAGSTATLSPMLATGSTGGAFSASPAGLSLNAGTGAIDVSQSQSGTYTITNTVAANGCAAVAATTTFTVAPVPAQPTLTASGAVLTASALPGATYQFYLNGVAIAGATAATYTTTQPGSYTVVVTSAAGCASVASAPFTVVVSAARASQAAFELTLYPNPTTDGRLTVALPGAHPAARLTLLNTLGQEVLTSTLPASASARELDLRGLASGVYLLRATTADGTVTHRVVRQ